MLRKPKSISKETVSLGRFTINYHELKLEENIFPYSYVEIKPGIVILPTYKKEIVLIKQYRYPLDKILLELPAGMIDADESPEEAAKRELLEETGYIADTINELGFFYPSQGSTTEIIHLFHAVCTKHINPTCDKSEQIEIFRKTEEEFKLLIQNNQFLHSGGIIAFTRYLLKNNTL